MQMLQAYPFWLALFTALASENAVFSRALGLTRPVLVTRKIGDCLSYGLAFTWMTFFASMGGWVVNWLLYQRPYARLVRALGFLFVVALIYVATLYLIERVLPKVIPIRLSALRRALPLTTFNSALFGALYMNIDADFLPTLGFALGTGVGYSIAILVILYIRKSLAARPVPKAFRGLPAALVYIGLLSLGIYGLIGHALPV